MRVHAGRRSSASLPALIGALAVLGLIPVATGVLGVVLGPVLGPTTPVVPVPVASEYRFLSVIWLAFGLQLWWSLRRPGERATVTRAALLVIFVGGLGRALSLARDGYPGPALTVALVIELAAVPALLLWHLRVVLPPASAGTSHGGATGSRAG